MKIVRNTVVADVTARQMVIYFINAYLREPGDVERAVAEIEGLLDPEGTEQYAIEIVVLNFARVKMVSSSFLGKLITLNRRCKKTGRRLRACCMRPDVFEGFRLLKLHKIIPVYKTVDDAVK